MTRYPNGFVPEGRGIYQEDCLECYGQGWRPMTQDEIDDAAEQQAERVILAKGGW